MEVQVQEGSAMMYETVNDVLRAKRIDPEDVMLIRHTDSPKDKDHRFRRAQEAGYIKEYTAMQAAGFAKNKEYLMVFVGESRNTARFFALYQITNRFPTRAGHVPADYPNKSEVEADGEYMEFREKQLPPGLCSFTIEWGKAASAWKQHPAKHDKPIITEN